VKKHTKVDVVLYNHPVQLETRFVGTQLREHPLMLSERQCMNYAAGIGDASSIYFDDERPGGVLAHPMLATALTWQVAGRIWEFLPPGDFPTTLLLNQVHYSEHLLFYRPLRPGLRLTLRGQLAAILPHRAGTQIVARFDALDDQENRIFTEFSSALLRGVTCEPPGAGAEDLPAQPPAPPEEAQPQWVEALPFDPLATYIYDACADIHFPIHTSPRFAHAVGLPGVIIQGTQTLAKATSRLLQRQLTDRPSRLAELACRFAGMVLPGETLNLRVLSEQTTPQGTNLLFDVQKTTGDPVIRRGYARIVAQD
jgi:acyl dehydratase